MGIFQHYSRFSTKLVQKSTSKQSVETQPILALAELKNAFSHRMRTVDSCPISNDGVTLVRDHFVASMERNNECSDHNSLIAHKCKNCLETDLIKSEPIL